MFMGWEFSAMICACLAVKGLRALHMLFGSIGTFMRHFPIWISQDGIFLPFPNRLILSIARLHLAIRREFQSMNCWHQTCGFHQRHFVIFVIVCWKMWRNDILILLLDFGV